jgi:hypothetical protein
MLLEIRTQMTEEQTARLDHIVQSHRVEAREGMRHFSYLGKAIQDHAGSGSEANGVIKLFQQLNSQQQQDLLNFLRSL